MDVFTKMGCPSTDAELATDVLVSADMRGVDSHGVARLSGYVRLWQVGRINSKPNIKTIHETPSTATLDADAGLGLVSAPKAMELAIEKSKQVATGWVSVMNSNHFGIAGYHAMMAMQKDMVGMAMTNASPLVAPTFGKERMLGTNPIAVALPTREQRPFVADFATTTAANGKLEILQRKGEPMPLGWAQTKEGGTTDDASALKSGGALLPLGSDRDHGSHKGYCLGSIVDIFTSVFSGANYGPWTPPFPSFLQPAPNPVGKGLGHFLGAMRVDAFRPKEDYFQHMDNWIKRFKETEAIAPGQPVQIPGEQEFDLEAERKKTGVPLLEKVVDDLNETASKLGVAGI
jgi:LDH2 family malate/lactate/ureidoglycolate dehydrogenase